MPVQGSGEGIFERIIGSQQAPAAGHGGMRRQACAPFGSLFEFLKNKRGSTASTDGRGRR